MKEWKVLVILEYEWRVLRLYRKTMSYFMKQGMKLSSPYLCYLSNRLYKHSVLLSTGKDNYERMTGKVIVFYKYDE